MKILLTGSTGFIGRAILNTLVDSVFDIVTVGRNTDQKDNMDYIYVTNIDSNTRFNLEPQNINIIIHCAARVHVMNDSSVNQLQAFREVNTLGTLNLAKQAAEVGVKRFIFISTIKVNGELTDLDKPFKPDDTFVPTDPYGLSKYEAEVGLRKIAQDTDMEVVIIRPPLVYGPGVKANFASMMKWVSKGVILPLGNIKQNKRSLVSVENLVDLIFTCIDHPKASNQIFLVSDNDDVSTTVLLQNIATALNVKSRLIPIPSSWFNVASRLIGKPTLSQRLCGSLLVDITKTMKMLNWKPPYSSALCLKKTATAFIENSKNETL